MATTDQIVTAATIDPALLAALKAAVPEQVGDDLVLRLPDGRIFYIDGFFALDETGDGLPPVPGALALSRDVADLLLDADDFATAAGDPADTAPPPSSGAGFIPFSGDDAGAPAPADAAPLTPELDPSEAARRDRLAGRNRDDADFNTTDEGPATGHNAVPSNFHQFGSGFLGSASFGGGGTPAAGAVSISAGNLSSPTFSFSISAADLVSLHGLGDPAYAGWFSNMLHVLPITPQVTFEAFLAWKNLPADYEFGLSEYHGYQQLYDHFQQFTAGHEVWMARLLAGLHANDANVPDGTDLAQVFAGDDIIFGSSVLGARSNQGDRLFGYGGDDILIAYDGTNELYGGTGDDRFIVSQRNGLPPEDVISFPQFKVVDGGDGIDTLQLQVFDGGYPIDLTKYPNTITSVEVLDLLVYQSPYFSGLPGAEVLVPGTAPFLMTDMKDFAQENYNPVVVLDAKVVAEWGGTLTINSLAGRVHLNDLDAWTRLPDDPQRPGYAIYSASYNGVPVSLAISLNLEQPIDAAITGTDADDTFVYALRNLASYDGGAGDDTITTQLTPYDVNPPGFGTLDLGDPATPNFHNVEAFSLIAKDTLVLSAADVAAITDDRKTLWITSPFATNQRDAAGKVIFSDAANWQSLGYASVTTDTETIPSTRTGAVYSADINGQTVQIFIAAGIELPTGVDTGPLDTWSIWYDGVVTMPPSGLIGDLATIDFGGNQDNSLNLTLADARVLVGADGKISIVTDAPNDVVTFADPTQWTLDGVERGINGAPDFYVYTGHDDKGADVTLRLDIELMEPDIVPHATAGNDLLRVTETIWDGLNGGDGFDTLQILGDDTQMAGVLDLAAMGNHGPRNIELIDLRNGADNSLLLDAASVSRLVGSDVLYVIGDDAADGLDRVFLQDIGNWTRTGVIASPAAGAPDFVRYEANVVINGVATHLTVAVDGELGQPIGSPLP